jgi:regulatory protein
MKIKKKPIPSDNFVLNLNKTLRFLSFRPRSEKEISDFLIRKNVEAKLAEKIIVKLKENKFLDDKEFARWWIEQRLLIKPRAWRVIKIELKQKGIPSEIFDELNIDSKAEGKNDLASAIKLAEKRFSRYKNLTRQETYQKLGRYLNAKGFSWEIIKKSIDAQFTK